ncbi:PucR family transcriptional regulator [Streptomyces sp. NPDC090127]|uniref:PucR family transcriptional regulator n=1 Tax=Streptomyces sp. NPDC090127 TaxID=3365953 RepID=UPI00381590BA
MHVEDLLQLDRLNLALVWGDKALLGQEISGVTATDLEDPSRFLQPGEIVLSGLVWWSPDADPGKTERFVSALRSVGAAALLAGEETHGTVPDELLDACREHRVALLAVPAQTSFRAITDAVYLRQWGDLSRLPAPHYALPENVRAELGRLLERGTAPAELLDRAFAHLGTPPCHLLTSSGRTVARTSTAAPLPAPLAAQSLHGSSGTTLRVQAEGTDYDAWHLHLPEADAAPPRVLHEIADVMAQYRHQIDRKEAAWRQARDRLVAVTGAATSEANAVENALRACGLSVQGPYRVVVATMDAGANRAADDALTEALSHLPSASFAVGQGAGGEAIAVVESAGDDDLQGRLGEVWPLVHHCRPDTALHAGVSGLSPTPSGLGAALGQARYAGAAARATAPRTARVGAVEDLSDLESLLAGVPDDVRAAYATRTLGPLLDAGRAAHPMLLRTLEVFLAHNCSWSRTAEALHLHVNTVHYRIQRVEALTGRDLSRLDHKADLRAALLCR